MDNFNPPPDDLPDLIDRLIESHKQLCRKLEIVKELSTKLVLRTINVKFRLDRLVEDCEEDATTIPYGAEPLKSRICYAACYQLLEGILLQSGFMHHILTNDLEQTLRTGLQAHETVFNVLLGRRHTHNPKSSDSKEGGCVDGCEWYDQYGPFEWSLQPYTQHWHTAMSNTPWNWIKMRAHIIELMRNAEHEILDRVNVFLACAQRYVPAWFWSPDFGRWVPWLEIVSIEEKDARRAAETVVIKIFFPASKESAESDLITDKELPRQQVESKELDGSSDMSCAAIDPSMIFDGALALQDCNDRGIVRPIGTWLRHFGIQQWFVALDRDHLKTSDLPLSVQRADPDGDLQAAAKAPEFAAWPYNSDE